MKNITTRTLIDMELARIENLGRIADTMPIDPYRIYKDVQTFSTAMNDNAESFDEVLTGIHPDVLPVHLKRCNASEVAECICLSTKNIRVPQGATVSQGGICL